MTHRDPIVPRALLAALLAALALVSPAAVRAAGPAEVSAALDAWHLNDARRGLTALAAERPDGDPAVTYLRARAALLEGDYARAAALLGDKPNTAPEAWAELAAIAAQTAEVTKSYKKIKSPEGYFELALPPGRDEVLAPFALEALDRAYDQIGAELDHRPPTPIRVEVYSTTETLARVSSLTEEEIRASGTIALCKYNRLMITSPKALLRGYEWVDTLAHEYVHYVVNHKTSARVPIWMHEGLAKYLERRWRGADLQRLSPHSERLLARRVKARDLITFAQMHPSMAKLPTQEDAALAFAEVFTVMEMLRATKGEGAFAAVLDAIVAGAEAPDAIAHVFGERSFAAFERRWRAYLRKRPAKAPPGGEGYEERLRFEDEGGDAGSVDLSQIGSPKARDHVHLGELLEARGRAGAAAAQYDKALALLDGPHPVVLARLGATLTATGRAERAWALLSEATRDFPGYVPAWLALGRAALATERWPEALEAFDEAARINPFDPGVHLGRAAALAGAGDTSGAAAARALGRIVS